MTNERTLRRIVTLGDDLERLSIAHKFLIVGFLLEKERVKGSQATVHTEALSPVTDWIPRNGGVREEIDSFLLGEIRRSIPRCLTVALDLIAIGTEHPALGDGFGSAALDLIREELRKLDGESLAAASPDGSPSLHELLFHASGAVASWSFLAGATLDAMASHPEKMLGPLIDTFRNEDGSLHRVKVQEFFADRAAEYYQHVSRYQSSSEEGRRLRFLRETTANEARTILNAGAGEAPAPAMS